jgi:hypothetical protein
VRSLHRWFAGLTTKVKVGIAALISLAIAGIVGNRADAIFLWSTERAPGLVGSALGSPWTLLTVAASCAMLGLLLGWRLRGRAASPRERALTARVDELEAIGQKAELLLRLDAVLIRSVPELLNRQQREQTIRLLTRDWLKECAMVFAPDVSRATLLRPRDADWLVPWESFGMPESSLRHRQFYIGSEADPSHRRGIAGAVFVGGRHRVIHVDLVGGVWQADDPEYIEFEQTPFPRYRTFVAIPIRSERDEVIGVLCRDSKTPGIFDQEPLTGLLLALGQRIGMAINLYEILQELSGG